MSYVITPSSGSGSGVQNPMTANLDAGAFDIENVDNLTANAVVGLNTVSGASVIAGTELVHTDPLGGVSFYGQPPAPQGIIAFPIVGANPHVNEDTINQICVVLQSLGLIA